MTLHWDAATPEVQRVLELLAPHAFMQRFYLAGGTALALQLGHRISYDLDFFSATAKFHLHAFRRVKCGLA
jgi:hypothetical protein